MKFFLFGNGSSCFAKRQGVWLFGILTLPALACSKDDQANSDSFSGTSTFGSEFGSEGEMNSAGMEEGGNSQGSGQDSKGGGGGSSASDSNGEDASSMSPSGGDGNETDEGSDTEIRFDVGGGETGDEDDWGKLEPPERPDFSYIWIANSPESTVSKLDTVTVMEQGRYYTHPDAQGNAAVGDPSRTSVSRTGDMVVANRNGGVMKMYALPERCEDRNGSGGIDTSNGPGARGWNDEECRAWYTPMEYTSQRSVAWTSGQKDPDTGEFKNAKVWTTGANEGSNIIDIMLLNGDTGVVEERTTVDSSPFNVTASPYGAYGGAVDLNNNFWFSSYPDGWIVRVSREDMTVDAWANSNQAYGMFVDPKGRPWVCGRQLSRFDLRTETWTSSFVGFSDDFPEVQGLRMSGCMMDAEGRVWVSGEGQLMNGDSGKIRGDYMVAVDWESLEVVQAFHVPSHPHGISIDFDGYVWGVANGRSNDVYKVHPETGPVAQFNGLSGPYTYSDMTGYGIGLAQIHVD